MLKQIKILIVFFAALSLTAAAQTTNTFPTSGNTGIGTTSPSTALDVEAGGGLSLTVGGTGGAIGLVGGGVSSPTAGLNYGIFPQSGVGLGLYSIAGGIGFWGGTTPTENMRISNGNVGIGTTAPAEKLHIKSSTVYTQTNSIAQMGFGNLALEANETSKVVGNGAALEFISPANTDGSNGYVQSRILGSVDNAANSTVGGAMYLQTRATYNGSTFPWVNNITLTSNGNVGVGATSPSVPLEVYGSVKLTSGSGGSMTYADGTTQSTAWTGTLTGGDYAESVDITGSRDDYEPGDVLIVDSEHPGHFLKAAKRYSLAVAGVYSTKPGVVGRRQKIARELSKTEVPMAMVGIVPTKVSTENGAIKPSDVLVTSSRSGYAMKGTDRRLLAGAVIGKALGSLNSGTGVIEAVISLQ